MVPAASLATPERRFLNDLAVAHRAHCSDDCGADRPDALLAGLSRDGGQPAARDGRLVRVEVGYDRPEVIDLRGLDALEVVKLDAAEPNVRLILGDHPRLTHLTYKHDVARTHLDRGVLDLSGCPALVELDVTHARLTGLRGLPASLRVLRCSGNLLTSLDLSAASGLEVLVARGCQLDRLELSGLTALRELAVDDNPLRALELRTHPGLTELRATATALTELDASRLTGLTSLYAGSRERRLHLTLPARSGLVSLSVVGSDLEAFDTRQHPALEILVLTDGALRTLNVDAPKLRFLGVENNQLATLDLSRARALRVLKLAGNPMARVDLSPLARLSRDALHLSLPATATVVCTELQQKTLPELCVRSGLSKPTRTLAKMDAFQLHDFASQYNWDDGLKRLREVLAHPRCDLATALYLYWNAQPGEYAQYPTPADAPRGERDEVAFVRDLEAKVAAGRFERGGNLPFDVHDVDGVDLSDDDPRIPAVMLAPIRVAAGGLVEVPPVGAAAAVTKVKPAAKKPAAKKPAAKKPAAKRPAARKPAAKKPAATKPAAKKPAAKKPAARKPVGKKPAGKKPVARR